MMTVGDIVGGWIMAIDISDLVYLPSSVSNLVGSYVYELCSTSK